MSGHSSVMYSFFSEKLQFIQQKVNILFFKGNKSLSVDFTSRISAHIPCRVAEVRNKSDEIRSTFDVKALLDTLQESC